MRCGSCGTDCPPDARFCMSCGAEILEADAQEVRKTVTILFSDVSGSTAMGDSLDPESVRRVMGRYFDACRSVIEFHGGTIEKFIGDAVMAVFGVPIVHEDDALRAVRAADGIRKTLLALNEEFKKRHGVRVIVRTGINTGEVIAGDPGAGQAFVSGDAVNVAARLEQAAPPGEVLLAASTLELVRDAVDVESVEPLILKGKPEPFRAFRLVSVEATGEGVARRSDGTLVGRSAQLSQLEEAFEHAVQQLRCQMITVVGEPGVGKSRLVDAFTGELSSRAMIVRGRCLSYGEGITFYPAAEIVAQVIGFGEADAPAEMGAAIERAIADDVDGPLVATRLLRMLGLGGEDSQGAPEEIYWAVRKLLESAARHAPVVAVFDDIQWAEPALLDLLEHICDLSRGTPIVLVCMARPDIVDERPGWGAGRANASSIVLETLDEADSRTLAEQLILASNVSPDLTVRILEAAQGNPLFIEQVVAHLADQRMEVVAADHGHQGVGIPSTLTALLEARLDSLSDLQRAVLQRGAVEGQVFHRGGVATMLPSDLRGEVASSYGPLMQKEFIAPGEAELAGEDAFRFRHLLIKDAAYRALPKDTRADLHERLADWLLAVAGQRLPEMEEIVAYHLVAASQYREELGGAEAGSGLAHRAAVHFAAAGDRARKRGDIRAATTLLQRAAELGRTSDPDRPWVLLSLARVSEDAGQSDVARGAWRELDELPERGMDERLQAHVRMRRLTSIAEEDEGVDDDWAARARSLTDDAIAVLEPLGDDQGLAFAHLTRGFADWSEFRVSAAEGSWELAAEYARRGGDRAGEADAIAWLAATGVFGARPLAEVIPSLRETVDDLGDVALAGSFAEGCLSTCLAMQGDVDEGTLRRSCRRAPHHPDHRPSHEGRG